MADEAAGAPPIEEAVETLEAFAGECEIVASLGKDMTISPATKGELIAALDAVLAAVRDAMLRRAWSITFGGDYELHYRTDGTWAVVDNRHYHVTSPLAEVARRGSVLDAYDELRKAEEGD